MRTTRRFGGDRPAADPDGGAHDPIAHVVRPAVVARERRERGRPVRVAAPAPGKDDQPPGPVGHQLAEVHVLALEGSVERHRSGGGAAHRPFAGRDDQPRPVTHAGVAQIRRRRARDVERGVELVPRRLAVRDVHVPRDVGLGSCQLPNRQPGGIEPVDPEPRRLPSDGAGCILDAVGRTRQRARHLRPEEEARLAVADPPDPDRGMDRRAYDPALVVAASRQAPGLPAARAPPPPPRCAPRTHGGWSGAAAADRLRGVSAEAAPSRASLYRRRYSA